MFNIRKEFFWEAVFRAIENTLSPSLFLNQLPKLIAQYLPLKNIFVFYKENVGNNYLPYGESQPQALAIRLNDDSNLIKSFYARQDSLFFDQGEEIYRTLFNNDSDGLLDKFKLNYLFPLHSKKYYRGIILAQMEGKKKKHLKEIDLCLKVAANIFIPIIESERLESENDRNYYRLFKFDRLVLLGEMVASIAHELKTPINTMLLEVQELQDIPMSEEDQQASLKKIRQEIQRVNQFIESLLSFSKFQEISRESFLINTFVQKSLETIPRKRIPQNLKMTLDLEKNMIIRTDPNRLRQVFLNILLNAFDAVGDEGVILIKTYTEYKQTQKDTKIIISIQDNGPGIPQEIKEKVLEPFFTTKANGTGLGLYISYGIMKSLRGDLEIESNKRGTTVFIILPGTQK